MLTILIALNNNVSMESIIKILLGHTDIQTTKIYAKLMDLTVLEEMDTLKQKFSRIHSKRCYLHV